MPRNMSFMLTTEQVRNKTKTVTRRNGWLHIKRGDLVWACVKCQGLKKGEKVQKISLIKIIQVSREPLRMITKAECIKEGFPEMEPMDFVHFYCTHNKVKPYDKITRIEFTYNWRTKKDNRRYYLHRKIKQLKGFISLHMRKKTAVVTFHYYIDPRDNKYVRELIDKFGYSFQWLIS